MCLDNVFIFLVLTLNDCVQEAIQRAKQRQFKRQTRKAQRLSAIADGTQVTGGGQGFPSPL